LPATVGTPIDVPDVALVDTVDGFATGLTAMLSGVAVAAVATEVLPLLPVEAGVSNSEPAPPHPVSTATMAISPALKTQVRNNFMQRL
jgi:hypothetical protein